VTDIKWTKTYDLIVDSRHFQIFVSEQRPVGFHASCLWYDKGRVLKAPGQPGFLQIHLEQRSATTEDDALYQITDWVKTNFGKDYKLVLSQEERSVAAARASI
jgi:hypothetical protein